MDSYKSGELVDIQVFEKILCLSYNYACDVQR